MTSLPAGRSSVVSALGVGERVSCVACDALFMLFCCGVYAGARYGVCSRLLGCAKKVVFSASPPIGSPSTVTAAKGDGLMG